MGDVLVNHMEEFWFFFILILSNWFALRMKKKLMKDLLQYYVHIMAACCVICMYINWNEFCFVHYCFRYAQKSLKVILLL